MTFKRAGSAIVNHVAFVLPLEPAVAGVVPGLRAVAGNQASGTCVCVSHFMATEVADIRRP